MKKELLRKFIAVMLCCITSVTMCPALSFAAADEDADAATVAESTASLTAQTATLESAPVVGTPPDKPDGDSGEQGQGADTQTFDYEGEYSAVLVADGSTETSNNENHASTSTNQNVALAQNGGTLRIVGDTLTKSGDSSDEDNCNFYGVNSSVLAVGSASELYISDSNISSSSKGSNGIFSTDGATVYANNDIITTSTGDNSRGLDATYGGIIVANKMTINTEKEHCAALATDRGGGYISVTNSTINTAGSGSPLIYSTGNIEVDNTTGTASGSQIAGMEGKNKILIYNSNLTSTNNKISGSDPIKNAVILYQSNSGDADTSTADKADFEAKGSTLKTSITRDTTEAAFFYVTNVSAKVVLDSSKLDFDSDKAYLIYASCNSNSWGTAGSNGGKITFTAIKESGDNALKGDIYVGDDYSSADVYLTQGTTYTGKTTGDGVSKININVDSTSTWVVTENCSVGNFNIASGGKLIDESGNTVTIKNPTSTIQEGTSDLTVTVNGTYGTELASHAISVNSSSISRDDFDTEYGTTTTFGNNSSSAEDDDNDSEDSTGKEYETITFGSYPQTEIVSQASDSGVYEKTWATESDYIIDAVLYDTLSSLSEDAWDANGDTIVGDSKYRRLKKSNATGTKTTDSESTEDESTSTKPTESDTVSMYYGWSSSDTYHYFKYEPIEWRVLQKDDNDMFLLSEIVLDDQMYNPVLNSHFTWGNSTIRSWLNGYGSSTNLYGTDYTNANFMDTAFTSEEQSKIKTTAIANKENTSESTGESTSETSSETIKEGTATEDKIYLLSDDEVYTTEYGFANSSNKENAERQAKSSTYAKAMGTKSNDSGNCYWWLRTPGSHSGLVVLVRDSGTVYTGGQHASSKSRGIRPALHIDTSSTEEHIWDEGEITKKPTCTEKGEKTFHCTVDGCNETKTEEIAANGHSYEHHDMVKATIDASGYTEYDECTVCHNIDGKYTITQIDSTSIALDEYEFVYDGNEKKPNVEIKDKDGEILGEGTDYEVEFIDNIEPGIAKGLITFKGEYEGTYEIPFTILGKDTSNYDFDIETTEFIYDESEDNPEPNIEIRDEEGNPLEKDTDYDIEYIDNDKPGTAYIKITFKGHYAGEVLKPFTIVCEHDNLENIACNKATFDKNGNTEYYECPDCGKYFSDEECTEEIAEGEWIIPKATASLFKTAYTYTGKVITPAVSVPGLTKNTDYIYSYSSGRKNVGTYYATVTLKGDKYSGSKKLYFTINPKGTTNKTPKAAKKAFTAKWSKQSGKMAKSRITGYQLQYSTSSKFSSKKTVTIKGYSKTSKKISKLKSKTKYYTRVRTYMKVGSKTYYSGWSSTKSVKTK